MIRFEQIDVAAGATIEPHQHEAAQVLFSRAGTLSLTAESQVFLLPASRLAWIPAGVEHAIRFRTPTTLRTAYITDWSETGSTRGTRIFEASPLFRETLLRLVEDPGLDVDHRALLEQSLRLELATLPTDDLSLTLPSDPRALRVARALLRDPADARALAAWSQLAACSEKTLSRHFVAETGLTFRLWRRQARLLAALPILDQGASVAEAAHGVGFSSASAFTAAWRSTFGTVPTARSPAGSGSR